MDRSVLGVEKTHLGVNAQNVCQVLIDHATMAHHRDFFSWMSLDEFVD